MQKKSDELFRIGWGRRYCLLEQLQFRETKAAEGYLLQGYVDDDGRRLEQLPWEIQLVINRQMTVERIVFWGEDLVEIQ